MKNKFLAISASLSAGILLAFLIQLNASLGQKIGVLESSFMAHITGTILAFLIIAVRINKNLFKKISSSPKYLFAGGLFGVGITVIGNIVVPAIGLLVYMSLLTTLDLIFSTTADHFGLFGLPRFRISGKRIAGLVLALTGVFFIFWS